MRHSLRYSMIVISVFFVCACAHTDKDNIVNQGTSKGASDQLALCQQEALSLKQESVNMEGKISELKQEKQSLLEKLGSCQDENIKYLGENNALLAQIANLKGVDEQKKQADKKLQKNYDYMLSFLDKERLEGSLLIIKESDDIRILISQTALFPTEKSAWLNPKGKKLVKRIVQGLKVIDPSSVQVAGHTDNTPIPDDIVKVYPSNWHLGMARALAVLEVFDAMGIQKETMYAISYGDTKPLIENNSKENRAMNRRVEIVILP